MILPYLTITCARPGVFRYGRFALWCKCGKLDTFSKVYGYGRTDLEVHPNEWPNDSEKSHERLYPNDSEKVPERLKSSN